MNFLSVAVIGTVTKGQKVGVTFPIAETVKKVDIERQRYVLTLKGNDVVNINPPGKFCPFYQRDFYRDNVTRWKNATRFVSDQEIYW